MKKYPIDLDKKGIIHLAEFGDYEVIANYELLKQDNADKFAVVNDDKNRVISVHQSRGEAISEARDLNA